MTILDQIIETKYQEVLELRNATLPERTIPIRPRLEDTLRASSTLEVIAEIKRASPSKGMIHPNLNAVDQAKRYADGGAAAISVLTDSKYFSGSFADLKAVAESVSLPVLCKDFMVDPIQIDTAYASGASIVLLIVAALEEAQLQSLYHYATSLGLEVLVEVHTDEELKIALELGATLIGINNRDLKTFTVSLETTELLAAQIPQDRDVFVISESGIVSSEDAERLSKYGAQGLLVGESLVRSSEVEQAIGQLKVRRPSYDSN